MTSTENTEISIFKCIDIFVEISKVQNFYKDLQKVKFNPVNKNIYVSIKFKMCHVYTCVFSKPVEVDTLFRRIIPVQYVILIFDYVR